MCRPPGAIRTWFGKTASPSRASLIKSGEQRSRRSSEDSGKLRGHVLHDQDRWNRRLEEGKDLAQRLRPARGDADHKTARWSHHSR